MWRMMTQWVFILLWDSPNNFSVMPEDVTDFHYLSQLPDCLDAVDLTIPLVLSRMPLVLIPRR